MSKQSLENYIKLNQVLDELNSRTYELEDIIDMLDENIEESERIGMDSTFIDFLCKHRNKLDSTRIELALKANEVERAILNLEKIRSLTN